jgi:threonine/homoserine/homoserine lactone efflux protein
MLNFLRGLLIGISIAAPVGPIGVLCIRRTLAEGRLSGLVSGLGAATADAFYGIIAGFGLTLISGFLVAQQKWLSLFGGIFLCYLGIRTFLSTPADESALVKSKGVLRNYLSIFILTLTNPMTILSFAAIFAGLGLANQPGDYLSAMILVLGVFSGSASWWLILSFGVSLFRGRVTPQWMVWINRVSGLIILTFGISALAGLLFQA